MKRLFAFLTAALVVFACGKVDPDFPGRQDDPDDPWEEPDDDPDDEIIDFPDLSDLLGEDYVEIVRKLGAPDFEYGFTYLYNSSIEMEGVEALYISFNGESGKIYNVIQLLKAGAYRSEDIRTYFDDLYYSYGTEEETFVDEDDTEVPYTSYGWGDRYDMENASIVVTLQDMPGNQMVTYTAPADMPTGAVTGNFGDITPLDVVSTFLGKGIDYILDEFGDRLAPNNGAYWGYAGENNTYLVYFTLFPDDDGVVSSIVLMYNDDLSDDDIIAYYEDAGYEIHETGEDEETGAPTYLFMNMNSGVAIYYCDLWGVAMFID